VTAAELVARYLDRDVQVGLDADSWGRHLAGQALHESHQKQRPAGANSETGFAAEWRFGAPEVLPPSLEELTQEALDMIAAKLRVPSLEGTGRVAQLLDLRYREALRAAQRILEEVE